MLAAEARCAEGARLAAPRSRSGAAGERRRRQGHARAQCPRRCRSCTHKRTRRPGRGALERAWRLPPAAPGGRARDWAQARTTAARDRGRWLRPAAPQASAAPRTRAACVPKGCASAPAPRAHGSPSACYLLASPARPHADSAGLARHGAARRRRSCKRHSQRQRQVAGPLLPS